MKLRYLITGTGGCGTKSIGMAFVKAGFRAGHEEAFGYTGIYPDLENDHPDLEVESSWLAAYHLPKIPDDVFVVHIIRNPLRAIESIYDSGMIYHPNLGSYSLYVHNVIQSLHGYDSPWDKTAHFVVEWNKMIEPYAHLTHKIEDGVPALMERLGVEFDPAWDKRYHASHKAHPELKRGMIHEDLWWKVLTQKVEYGY